MTKRQAQGARSASLCTINQRRTDRSPRRCAHRVGALRLWVRPILFYEFRHIRDCLSSQPSEQSRRSSIK